MTPNSAYSQGRDDPDARDGHSGPCHIHLVAAGPHESVPGGVLLTDAVLPGLDAGSRSWLDELGPRYAVFAVPAAGEDPQDAGGVLDRLTRTVEISAEEYRQLLGLRPL